MGILKGKRALIVGVASKHSIAHGIAEVFHQQGAELAFTYQNEKLKSRVVDFAQGWGSELTFPCDVANDDEIDAVFTELGKHWDKIDIIVHAVGFAPAHELNGNYVDVTTRDGFKMAHDISSGRNDRASARHFGNAVNDGGRQVRQRSGDHSKIIALERNTIRVLDRARLAASTPE